MRAVEESIQRIIDATGLRPKRVTFVKQEKPIFTIDWTDDGEARVIYSAGFLRAIASTD